MFDIIAACLCMAAILLPFIVFAWRRNAQLSRALEESRRKEALGTLASGVAHDFNNILGSITGFSALLEEDLITLPEQREMVRHIRRAATRGQSIVAELMRYGRQGAARGETPYTEISLDSVVRESMALLKPALRSSTQLRYDNAAAKDQIIGNATQISEALVNLCVNADHAIGDKAGEIVIRLFNDENSLNLSVQDNGSGMDDNIAKKIFDPFFTTKEDGKGTGLGLATVDAILKAHAGKIALATAPHKGSTFTLTFPLPPQSRRAAPPVERALS